MESVEMLDKDIEEKKNVDENQDINSLDGIEKGLSKITEVIAQLIGAIGTLKESESESESEETEESETEETETEDTEEKEED